MTVKPSTAFGALGKGGNKALSASGKRACSSPTPTGLNPSLPKGFNQRLWQLAHLTEDTVKTCDNHVHRVKVSSQ